MLIKDILISRHPYFRNSEGRAGAAFRRVRNVTINMRRQRRGRFIVIIRKRAELDDRTGLETAGQTSSVHVTTKFAANQRCRRFRRIFRCVFAVHELFDDSRRLLSVDMSL